MFTKVASLLIPGAKIIYIFHSHLGAALIVLKLMYNQIRGRTCNQQ